MDHKLAGHEQYDDAFWQDGIAGTCNVVTFNGEDVRGVMRIENTTTRLMVIGCHNAVVRRLRNNGPDPQPFENFKG